MKPIEYIKKGCIFLMLMAYVFGILKPLSPILKDVIAHTIDKANHMATVHYENGKYHVHKELAVEATEDTNKKSATENNSSEEFLANHLYNELYKFNAYYLETSVINTETDTKVFDIFFKTFTPPPEA